MLTRYLRHGWLVLLLCLASLQPLLAAPAKISIEGINGRLKDNVLAWLSLAEEPCDAPGWRVQARLEKARGEIRQALQGFGYYQPNIRHLFEAAGKNGCWHASFTIEPGRRVMLRNIDVKLQGQASTDAAFTRLINSSELKSGQPLRQDHYQSLKNGISDLAASRGYLDGQFSQHELRVDPAAGYADIHLHFDSGPGYRFGEIRVQQDIIDPALLQHFLAFQSGDLYSRKTLSETSRALSSSGYFERVLVQPLVDQAMDRQVPVNISLEPSKRHAYSASIGYATDTGPRFGLGYRNQRLNTRGHQFDSDLSVSRVISKLTLGYSIPLENPVTDKLTYAAGFKHENTDSYVTDTTAVSAALTHKHASGWLEERSLTLSREDYTIDSEDTTTSRLFMPADRWLMSTADDRLYPRKGLRLHFKVNGSLEQVLSDVSFLQVSIDARGVLGLPWRSRLIGRVNTGGTLIDQFDNLPTSVRYFAGGDSSVRGYAYKSLGPENVDGVVQGGRNLLVGSIEIEHLISGRWGLAAFVDSGNAFNEMIVAPKTGIGVGIRWRSPIGPIRLDFAHPTEKNLDQFRIHFSMGPEF